MIFSGDTYVPLPTKELYDTQMMLAAVSAAKDMYDRAYKEQQNFIDEYKNYTSPSIADTQFVRQNTVGKVMDAIDDLYKSGIDPLRSREGRSRMGYLISKLQAQPIQEREESRKNMEEYAKNVAKAQLAGTYNPELEDIRLNGKNPKNWNTSTDGIWTETAPAAYENPEAIVTSIYGKLGQDEYLSDDPNNSDYYLTGVSRATLDQAEPAAINALKQSPSYPLLRKQIIDKLANEANNYDPKTGNLTYIDDKGNATVKNTNDPETIDEELLKMVRHYGAQYTQPKSVLKESAKERIKASYSRTSSGGGGSSRGSGGGKVTEEKVNVIENAQNSYLNHVRTVSQGTVTSTPYDVVYNQVKKDHTKDGKVNTAHMINDDRLTAKVDKLAVSAALSGSTSLTFDMSLGLIRELRSAVEACGGYKTTQQNKTRDDLIKYAQRKDGNVRGSSTGKIKMLRSKDGSGITPYFEIVVDYNSGTNDKPNYQHVTMYIPTEIDYDNDSSDIVVQRTSAGLASDKRSTTKSQTGTAQNPPSSSRDGVNESYTKRK